MQLNTHIETFRVPQEFVDQQDRRYDNGRSGYLSRANMDYEIWEYLMIRSHTVAMTEGWRSDFVFGGLKYDNKHLAPVERSKYFELSEKQMRNTTVSIAADNLDRFNFWTGTWDQLPLRGGDIIKIENHGSIDAIRLLESMRPSQYSNSSFIDKRRLLSMLEPEPFLEPAFVSIFGSIGEVESL